MKKILITLSIALLSACSVPNTNSFVELPKTKILNTNPKSIKGIVQFPLLSSNRSEFNTKASFEDVSKQSSVSIIYPPDSVNANKVLSSTVSDDNGSFDLNLTKNPENNEILILEASKRFGGVGNNIMSLRTYIKWTGTEWKSMTTPNIYINSYTNALAIIAGYNKDKISSNDLIDKILVNLTNNSFTVSDITGTNNTVLVSSQTIDTVKGFVDSALGDNKDPFLVIKYANNSYFIDNSYISGEFIDSFLTNDGCINCDLRSKDLSSIDFKDKNLTGANLSGLDLSDKDFTNTNLTNANLAGANLSGVDLSTTIIKGANFTDAYLIDSKIIARDLTGTNFTYAYMKNADLSGSIISSTVFSDADLSNALWIDNTEAVPHICANHSYGVCN